MRRDQKSRKPRKDHAKRRREITNALMVTIGRHGFAKASMRLVAREANCTTGALTHYFTDKADLMCKAVDLLFDWAEQMANTGAEGNDTLEALRVIANVSETGERPPFDFWAVWLQVLPKSKQDPRLAQTISKRHGRFRAILVEIIRLGQDRRQIRSDIEADLLADHFNAVMDGIGLMAPIESKHFGRTRVAQLMNLSISFLEAKKA